MCAERTLVFNTTIKGIRVIVRLNQAEGLQYKVFKAFLFLECSLFCWEIEY